MRQTWHERVSHLSVTSPSTSSNPVISQGCNQARNCLWRHGTPRFEKQRIDVSVSRLATYQAVRDDMINNSRARRTQRDPNAMQVDAVHVNVNQERQVDGSGSRSDKGKGGKGGKGKSKKGCKSKERGERERSKRFQGECRDCQKRGHKKSDCRKMKSDIAAGKSDKSGKPIGVNALSAAGTTQPSPQATYAPSMASTIPLQQMVPVYLPCPNGSQTSETWFINMTSPENSHGCKLGRSRMRVVGFWIWLDILPNHSCPIAPTTSQCRRDLPTCQS